MKCPVSAAHCGALFESRSAGHFAALGFTNQQGAKLAAELGEVVPPAGEIGADDAPGAADYWESEASEQTAGQGFGAAALAIGKEWNRGANIN
jgi:hypothetical protein